ncbi:MAG TPA: HEAT repeat domain-containing protein [Kofleriaceae bacterium]|nr:HEAT repeat domain-containing protein [Kofleriaceae bacterium]
MPSGSRATASPKRLAWLRARLGAMLDLPRGLRLALPLALGLTAAAPRPAAAWTFEWAGHVEVDAEGLASEDAAKRLEAVAELTRYDISLTQAHLMRMLDDPEERVRLQVARALGQGGALAAVPVMIDWLANLRPEVRSVAVTALGDIGGTEAAAALTRSLSDPDPNVRKDTVRALGTIGRKGNSTVVVALIPRLEDDKAEVRLATIAQLEDLGDRRAVIPLVARFGDTGVAVRSAAVRAIGKLGDRSAVPALIRLMNDPDESVRLAAVGSLGSLGAVDAIDALIEQLSSGGDAYRAKVAYALGQIAGTPGSGTAGEDAMRTLVVNLAQSPSARNAAREALRAAGKAAVPALVAHLQGRLAGDPTTAVELLADTGDPRATATLAAELERGRVAMPKVLRALGGTADPNALVPVLRALASKDPAIRLAAMNALRPLIGTDARAGDVLIEHLADEDLEIRVLAVEYLGILEVGAAAGKLIALAGPGNPMRLRRAAIDALGEIGRPEASKTLVGLLREGPAELHRSAATALAYIADPAAVAFLVEQAQSERGATRHEVVRALGASLRGRSDAKGSERAREILRKLATDAPTLVGLAAIGGLAAARDKADAPLLRSLVEQGGADRRRAAAWALGEMQDPGSLDALLAVLSVRDDRLVGDAAWALGEILAAAPKDARAAAAADRWLYLGKHGGWAAAIDSAAGLGRLLWALPRAERTALLAPPRRANLQALAFHKSRLVRINAAHALASLAGDDDATKALAQLLRDDVSVKVKIAAARGLARLGGPKAAAALKTAEASDSDAQVREAAREAGKWLAPGGAVPPLPARTEWRTFYVVDPGTDDAPVRQEQYFVHTADGLIWASYTDGRGELSSEHMPPGDAVISPASRESEY